MAQSAALTQLRTAVQYMLKEGHSHADITGHVRDEVLKIAAERPSRKVLYNACYGGFSFNRRFEKVMAAKGISDREPECREDPKVLEAIMQFGREMCEEFPFVHDAVATSQGLGLQELMIGVHAHQYRLKHGSSGLALDSEAGTELLQGDLFDRATAFYLAGGKEYYPYMLRFNIFRSRKEGDLWQMLRSKDELWMLHRSFAATEQAGGLLFASEVLKSSPEMRPEGTPSTDADAYQFVGLVAASGDFGALQIQDVPAMVNYTIDEYDGRETVSW